MAFYEQELAKLEARVAKLEGGADVDDNLKPHESLAGHLNPQPPANRTPQPNTISPALPNVVVETPEEQRSPAQPNIGEDDHELDGENVSPTGDVVPDSTEVSPTDPYARPEDGQPNEQTTPVQGDDKQGE